MTRASNSKEMEAGVKVNFYHKLASFFPVHRAREPRDRHDISAQEQLERIVRTDAIYHFRLLKHLRGVPTRGRFQSDPRPIHKED